MFPEESSRYKVIVEVPALFPVTIIDDVPALQSVPLNEAVHTFSLLIPKLKRLIPSPENLIFTKEQTPSVKVNELGEKVNDKGFSFGFTVTAKLLE